MKNELKRYIKNNLNKKKQSSHFDGNFFSGIKELFSDFCIDECVYDDNISSFIEDEIDDNSFKTVLFKMIDERNLKDSEVYNKVHIDRRLFSKIRNDNNYHPSKETVILFGLALQLNEDEIELLLGSASYSLPKNNYYDLIIRFCFINKIYDIKTINDLLDEYDCPLFNY